MSNTTAHGDTRLPELLSLRELAAYLGVPASSVYYWRTQGKGPPGFPVGKQLRFRAADVDTWIQEQADRAGVA
jgi:excisionase family DNA binding protein